MLEQGGYSYDNPYKFNSLSQHDKVGSKELDKETGLYYYGARYYDPAVSYFLSTDPLAEKYPGMMPYNYTMNNPVRFVDPDGKESEDWIYDKVKKEYKWDGNVKSEVDIKDKERYEYVGVGTNDIYKHYNSKHPILKYFTNPNVNYKSFNKYLSQEIINRVQKFVTDWKEFKIDNIRGLKENIDLKNALNKGRFELPIYDNNNKKVGFLNVKFIDINKTSPINYVIYDSGNFGEHYPYQLLFFNRENKNKQENAQAILNIFYNNENHIYREIEKKILKQGLKYENY
jgi:RHS repeat-associated protein